jgi:hypothetical protein
MLFVFVLYFPIQVLGGAYAGTYFEQRTVDEAVQWVPKDGVRLSPDYLKGLQDIVAKQLAEGRSFLLLSLPFFFFF